MAGHNCFMASVKIDLLGLFSFCLQASAELAKKKPRNAKNVYFWFPLKDIIYFQSCLYHWERLQHVEISLSLKNNKKLRISEVFHLKNGILFQLRTESYKKWNGHFLQNFLISSIHMDRLKKVKMVAIAGQWRLPH